MVLFDSNNKIKKYNNIEEIINEFYDVRLDFYKKRKTFLLAKMGFALEKNKNKKKFINMVLEGELPFKGTKNKKEVFKLLKTKKLTSLNELKNKYKEAFQIKSTEIVTEKNDNEDISNSNNIYDEDVLDYDYLMNMNIWSLTYEKVIELEELIKAQTKDYELLKISKPEDLWKKDLEEFMTAYQKIVSGVDERNKEAEKKIDQNKSKAIVKGKTKRGQKNTKENNNNKKNNNSVKKKNKKKEDSFIDDDEEEEYISESDEDSSSSSVSSENFDLDSDGDDPKTKNKKQNKSNKASVTKTAKTKVNKIKEDIISLEENEEEEKGKKKGKTSVKKNNSKPASTTKKIVLDDEEEIEINKKKNNLSKDEKTLLKNLGVEKVKNVKDPTMLSLRERLALRVANGNIDSYLNNLDNKNNNSTENNKNSKKMEDITDIKEIEEILDENSEFLKKKKKPSVRKPSSAKKTDNGKYSTKKKKIIEDSEDFVDDDKDEDFKL
jgi:DNA topoisomerase-2